MESQNQISNIIESAYKSVLESTLSDASKIDIKWLCKLYEEIRNKLCNLTPNNKKNQDYILQHMDLNLFKQMVENNAFNKNDLQNLIKFVFDCILKLQAPIRDDETKRVLTDILTKFDEKQFGENISNFVIKANKCIDLIYKDLEEFYKNSGISEQTNKTSV